MTGHPFRQLFAEAQLERGTGRPFDLTFLYKTLYADTCQHRSVYSCVGCNKTHCLRCHAPASLPGDECTTAVRWCADCRAAGRYTADAGNCPRCEASIAPVRRCRCGWEPSP